ncbi:Pfam:Acid phosphat A [Geosmithia morbida]|uniref:Phytase A n=1 Tax=Geosmithia morbida TaxID=1094350 RepID=A0A9P4Z0N9_9HYPO|nr:Pfam:Acid phosphat A [Geosmithia morbida]KAF4125274.1 Pfam:Acid phosphat A [Geosmithia morbida]
MSSMVRHEYSLVTDSEKGTASRSAVRRQKRRGAAVLAIVLVALATAFVITPLPHQEVEASSECEATASCNGSESTHLWGQYSPFFPVPSDLETSVPDDCSLTSVSVLSRHGSRFPTAHKTETYSSLISRIQESVTEYADGFEFIRDYTYDLGSDSLTAFGQQQLSDLGSTVHGRYGGLVSSADDGPFVRASGSARVIMSAENFTSGFYAAKGTLGNGEAILVVSEDEGYNNTLNHGACTQFEEGPDADLGDDKQAAYAATWIPDVTDRLNAKLPGANLTDEETVYVMDLCPYDTVASDGARDVSKFCNLFSRAEWLDYDYYRSVEKWYAYGSGNPLGSTQGVGYVNELVARLTRSPVKDHTSTNSTLDSDPATFPLNRTLYADFSHDNTMSSIYAALGLYNATGNLPVDERVEPGQAAGYSAAWTVPFAGRMYVEKMSCAAADEELVRILVNDRVVPLQSCDADELGRCRLSDFVDSLSFARDGGDWDKCFV